MLQPKIINRLFPSLSKTFWLRHFKKFSNSSIKDESNTSHAEENVESPLRDNNENEYSSEEVEYLLKESTTYKDINNKQWATTPYPKDAPIPDGLKPFKNPENSNILLFPGQGTIKVGMVNRYMHFPDAKELFEIANEILGYNLLKLCLDGPQEKLNKTEFNQPATVVSSLAALEKLKEERPRVFENCVATAGYSVGEISALILSGAISFEDGVRLVCVRGKTMQLASNMVPQGMLSVQCAPEAQVFKACQDAEKWAVEKGVENPICRVAIYLCTERKILAGNTEALEYIEFQQKQYGIRNVTRLPVSGAFHTPLMEPALKAVFKMLSSIQINEPRCKVYSNYKGAPYQDLRFMKKYILKQIVSPVKWEQCLQSLYQRPAGTPFPKTFDVGSEGRMKTILKLINLKAANSCILV